jgi:methylthioribose-1-phosphate isomerase
MVALDTTDSNNAIGTLRDSICHQKFELPNFVAAQFHSSEIIPLQSCKNIHIRIEMQIVLMN